MIVVMKTDSSQNQLDHIINKLESANLGVHLSKGVQRTIIGVIGERKDKETMKMKIEAMNGVEKVVSILDSYKLVGKEFKPEKSVIDIGGVKIGGEEVVVMAGPCSVENEKQIVKTADAVKKAGAKILRGGAYKPRTSPYSFQGLGEEGLKLMALAKQKTGLKIVTELIDKEYLEIVCNYADIIQIGSRNMHNYSLLKALGNIDKPVLLKRGFASTIKEWLLAAEYVMKEGNHQVILCERGIRTFGEKTRNTLDLSSVPLIQELSHLPIVVDPSHGTGNWRLVSPMARAAVASGADGLMVEVHPQPEDALSDGQQSLTFDNFNKMMSEIVKIAEVLGKKVYSPGVAV
ncbi:MAG: 3-deoxy-7-phosphoheptulonate synthase [Halanaerobiales bacterium]|nr:3-deoxy-7-phosphoheptulonate synthase [Halanaerobiales bacterium]